MEVGDLVRHINLNEIFVVVDKPVKTGLYRRASVADHRGVRKVDVGFLEVINEE